VVNNPFVAGTVTVTMEMNTQRKVAVKVGACMCTTMELQLQFYASRSVLLVHKLKERKTRP
jgi:hypothetical protein